MWMHSRNTMPFVATTKTAINNHPHPFYRHVIPQYSIKMHNAAGGGIIVEETSQTKSFAWQPESSLAFI